MNWIKQLNDAITYIEGNLKDKIDYDNVANIAGCTSYQFQRMFPYIAGVTLSEYIRRRRLTLAAFELQRGAKVIDVALRYGYESPTAFHRAFKNIHGVAPSLAGKVGVILKSYPPIKFNITIKGEVEMEYQIVKKEAFRVIGIKEPLTRNMEENFVAIPKFWDETSKGDTIPKLCSLMDHKMPGVLSLCSCPQKEGEPWEYYICVASDQSTPEGMVEFQVDANTWAVFSGEGKMPHGIQDLTKRIYSEWIPNSGYTYGEGPEIEVYLNNEPNHAKFEIWIPIKK